MQYENSVYDSLKLNRISFQAYGISVLIRSVENRFLTEILERLPEILLDNFSFIKKQRVDFDFEIVETSKGFYRAYRNKELLPSEEKTSGNLIDYFLSQIRLTIAEYSVSKVFVHAGVVGWKGTALVFPAISYGGKTTIVSELIKNGAEYFSDEYAVLDENGFVHPFPKTLSVREILGETKQTEIPFEEFGAVAGKEPIPVGLVLFTQYKQGSNWDPEILTTGQGILEIMQHTFPIRENPEFTIKVLNNTLNRAIIAKSFRGEVSEIINFILKFVEK